MKNTTKPKIDLNRVKKVELTPSQIQDSLRKPKDRVKVEKAIGAGKEAMLQDLCESHLVRKGIFYLHIPQSSYRGRGRNVLAGVPDLLIFKKEYIDNIPCVDNSCLLVELKTKVGKQNPKQRKWAKETVVHVIKSFAGFKELLTEWSE